MQHLVASLSSKRQGCILSKPDRHWLKTNHLYYQPISYQTNQEPSKKYHQRLYVCHHSVKAHVDELTILGAPIDKEDRIEKILDGLGDEYNELVHTVQARDTSITFDELHKKLLSFEASLSAKSEICIPILVNPTNMTNIININWRQHKTNTSWHPNHFSSTSSTS